MPSASEPIPHEPHESHESPERKKHLLARIAVKRWHAYIEGHSSRALARTREPVHALRSPVNAHHPHAEERRAATRLEAWATHPSVVPSEAERPLFHAETREREDRSLHAALRASVETTEVRGPVFAVYKRCESRRRTQAFDAPYFPQNFPQNPNRRKPTLNRRRPNHSPRHTAIACISRACTRPRARAPANRREPGRGIASPNRIVFSEREPTYSRP